MTDDKPTRNSQPPLISPAVPPSCQDISARMITRAVVPAALSVGLLAGFLTGVFSTLATLDQEKYLASGMWWLALEQFKTDLNDRVPITAGVCLVIALVSGGALWFGCRFWKSLRRVLSGWRNTAIVQRVLPVGLRFILWPTLLLWLTINLAFLVRGEVRVAGPNVLIIVVDALRADHLGCYGYHRQTSPAIDTLAEGGLLFAHAYANAPWTKTGVGAIITGLYPSQQLETQSSPLTDKLKKSCLTICEIFRNAGYETFFLNGGNAWSTPDFQYVQGVDHYFFQSYVNQNNEGSHVASEQIVKELAALTAKPGKRPFMAYMHFMDTHLPYYRHLYNNHFSSIRSDRFQPGSFNVLNVRGFELTENEKEHIKGLYDGQIKSVDQWLETILNNLRSAGCLDNTLILVTSDHGEEFWEHDGFEHGHSVYEEVLRVPLIISGPAISPERVSTRVQLVDIVPTLLDLAGLAHPRTRLAGRSLAPLLQNQELGDVPLFAEDTLYGLESRSFIVGNNKIILNTLSLDGNLPLEPMRSPPPFEIFDLETDPGERSNLAYRQDLSPQTSTVIATLRQQFVTFLEER